MGKKSVYEIVQEKMVSKIEEAIKNGEKAFWQKPWVSKMPVNYITRKPYRGINIFMLMDEGTEFITFNQISELRKKDPSIKLKKGCKQHMVVFFKFNEYEKANENGETEKKTIPLLRFYTLYSISDVEGLTSRFETFDNNPIEEAELVIKNYVEASGIGYSEVEGFGQAFYSPMGDYVKVPAKNGYKEIEKFYSTVFHELAHSTGHPKRLNRFDTKVGSHTYGSEVYSKEEMIAEFSASMMLGSLGINTESTEANNKAYLQCWLEAIRKDTTLLISASSQAQKVCDLLLQNVAEVEEVA